MTAPTATVLRGAAAESLRRQLSHECDDYHDGYCSRCCKLATCPACETADERHGYVVTTTRTVVERWYVLGTRLDADERADRQAAAAWASRSDGRDVSNVDVTVTRCDHDSASGQHRPLTGAGLSDEPNPRGLVDLVDWQCDLCGDTWTAIEHEALAAARDDDGSLAWWARSSALLVDGRRYYTWNDVVDVDGLVPTVQL